LNSLLIQDVFVTDTKSRKFRRIRHEIIKQLNRTHWAWNPGLSILLDQVDAQLFGMRQEINERFL